MQYRRYGRHEVKLSIVGFGGICVMNESESDARRIVDTAINRGINYFDIAPTYGNAQAVLGPALEPHRESVFLACKSKVRSAEGVIEEFDESCRALRTDRFDLYQIHGIQTEEDVDQVLSSDGALAALRRLRDEGRVDFLGFSAHNEDAALRLLTEFPFDSVLFPVNRYVWYSGWVGARLVEAAERQGVAVLALKSLAHRRWHHGEERTWSKSWYKPADTVQAVRDGLRFTLSRSVVSAVSPGHEELLWMTCDAADRFEPLSEAEEQRIAAESLTDTPVFSRSITAI